MGGNSNIWGNFVRQDQELLNGRVVTGNLVGMEVSQQAINVLHGLVLDIGQLLDLASNGLQVLVRQSQAQLLCTVLDRVPASEAMADRDVASHAKDLGLENLVCCWVVQDRLGVDAGLVGEGTVAGDAVVEGHLDLDGVRNQVLQIAQLVQLVLGGDVVWVNGEHACDEVADGCDSVALADTEDGGIDVGGTSFQCGISVGSGASGIYDGRNVIGRESVPVYYANV